MTAEALVIARDQGCCARCGRHVAGMQRGRFWSIHHRRPRGSGGSSLTWVNGAANLLILCGSGVTGCHGEVESRRASARMDGFLIPLNGVQVAEDVPVRHALHGLARLTDDGGWVPVLRGPTPDMVDWKEAA
ncbi:HNH endonuclease [Microbacterium sp. KNMS]